MIGIDYYFNFVTGKIKRGPPGCPVAIESNFGWILSGPNGRAKKKSKFVSSNIVSFHTMFVDNITRKTDDDLSLKGSIQKFWEVQNVGVDEHPVYENFKQSISFDGERSQWAHHVEYMSIRRGYYVDTSKNKFRRISTSFPDTFSM